MNIRASKYDDIHELASNHTDFHVSDLKKYKDGEVFLVNDTFLIKCGKRCASLNSILRWDGLEEYMEKLPQTEAPVNHIFTGGVYVRQMTIPRGTFIIGKRHRYETCNILLKGKLSVYLGDGKPVQVIEAPMVLTSEPMVRKIAYAHEETVFLNIHPTSETDLEKIEKKFIITEQEATKCLGEP